VAKLASEAASWTKIIRVRRAGLRASGASGRLNKSEVKSQWELAEPKRSDGFVSLVIKRIGQMKLTALLAASAVVLSTSLALAQSAGGPSGRGATTGDPAASSATPGSAPTTGNSMKSNPSGSGTSTSGGKDDNGDQGRDKMPESNQAVRPNNKPDKM
jgi:hypothetical protein